MSTNENIEISVVLYRSDELLDELFERLQKP